MQFRVKVSSLFVVAFLSVQDENNKKREAEIKVSHARCPATAGWDIGLWEIDIFSVDLVPHCTNPL